MPTVKIASKLPDGESNGLIAIHTRLVRRPSELVTAVIMLDTKELTTDLDTGEVTPTARIRHIEALREPRDAQEIARLMLRERERRLGRAVLPLDLEHELARIVNGVDPDTGELRDDG